MDKIDGILTRGVDKVYPSKEELEKVLRSGKKLRVYQGFDPTSPCLHIGHLSGLIKLKQWQDLGHEVIFLIGDYTGMVGDPTGKDKTRIPLSHEKVMENAKSYKEQAAKILDFEGENPAKLKYNGEWLGKLSAIELANLASNLTLQQVIERDMFQKRIKNQMDISISEFMYPFMQGYDSVAMDVDVEIGGTDQMFNMMIGRDLMKKIKKKNKFVMTIPLLQGLNGVKIGKTEGNAIALSENPNDMFSKVMSLPDETIMQGLELLTMMPVEKISELGEKLKNCANPMTIKKILAFEIVKELHTEEDAESAAKNFERTVQGKEPSIKLYVPKDFNNTVLDIVSDLLFISRSKAKRKITDGGVRVNDKKITMEQANGKISVGMIIQVGKLSKIKIQEKE